MRASDDFSTTNPSGRARRSASRRTPDRFALSGPSIALDPRVNAVRKDLADVDLARRLFAPHYAKPVLRSLRWPSAPIRVAGAAEARAESQLLHGEHFAVLDVSGGFAWGYGIHDHYVGYVEASALGEAFEATHVVTAREALLFAEADIRAPVLAVLPIGSRLAGVVSGDFLATDEGLVHRRHVSPAGEFGDDVAAIAERLVGAPYRWGGRGAGGIDCSGLVQLAWGLAGHPLQRDSDMQRASAGEPLPKGTSLRRGDLLFFPGHVGMLLDGERLIHANSHHMLVTIEPMTEIVERLGLPELVRRVAE